MPRRLLPSLAMAGAALLAAASTHAGHPSADAPKKPPPEQAPPKKALPQKTAPLRTAPAIPAWRYVLPVDHGIRVDRAGKGHFMAPRRHGKHNGIDLLAPVGTPLMAACNGEARGGRRGGFGTYVHLVCPVPAELAGGRPMFASFFYAHLQLKKVPQRWTPMRAGDVVGTVGKTGNARGPTVMPHVHFELILHDSLAAARKERHSGRDQHNTTAADRFVRALQARCTGPHKISSPLPVRRARRADPFLALTCAHADKPALKPAPGPLAEASRPFSTHYVAPLPLDQHGALPTPHAVRTAP